MIHCDSVGAPRQAAFLFVCSLCHATILLLISLWKLTSCFWIHCLCSSYNWSKYTVKAQMIRICRFFIHIIINICDVLNSECGNGFLKFLIVGRWLFSVLYFRKNRSYSSIFRCPGETSHCHFVLDLQQNNFHPETSCLLDLNQENKCPKRPVWCVHTESGPKISQRQYWMYVQ